MAPKDVQSDPGSSLSELADDLYDKTSDTLADAARKAGIRIVDASMRVCLSRDIRLAAAVATDFAEANAATAQVDPVMGVFYIEGRVRGQLNGPGFYAVRVVNDGADRIAVISDSKGKDVFRAPVKTTCDPEVVAAENGCCSGPEIGEGFVCVGFSCCNPIGGCISNEFCFTT